jgi:hypothetical protein
MFDTAMGLGDDIQKLRIKREGSVSFPAFLPKDIPHGIAKALCIVAGYSPSSRLSKQKRVTQSHPGLIRTSDTVLSI